MKFKIKQFIYSLGIIGVMLMASNVYSQSRDKDFPGCEVMRGKMNDRMLEVFKQLDLSPEQEKQLQTHRDNHCEQAGEFRESLITKKEALRSELQKEELNMEEIYKIHNELKDLHSKKADHRLEGILEVRKILTAEQFVKYMELKKGFCHMKKECK